MTTSRIVAEWYDSDDPSHRRSMVGLTDDGRLFGATRESPSDLWPPVVTLGRRYDYERAEAFALSHGLPHRVGYGVGGPQGAPMFDALGERQADATSSYYESPDVRAVCDAVIAASRGLSLPRAEVLALAAQHFGEQLQRPDPGDEGPAASYTGRDPDELTPTRYSVCVGCAHVQPFPDLPGASPSRCESCGHSLTLAETFDGLGDAEDRSAELANPEGR